MSRAWPAFVATTLHTALMLSLVVTEASDQRWIIVQAVATVATLAIVVRTMRLHA